MNKELKQKLEKAKLQESVSRTITPLYWILKNETEEKIANRGVLVVKNAIEKIEKQIAEKSFDTEKIVESIERQTEKLTDTNTIKIYQEITNLIKEVQKIEKKNYFDELAFKKIFNNGVDKIIKLLVDENQIPNSIEYQRDSRTRAIKKIIEDYDAYTLEESWRYDSYGDIIEIITIKNDKAF